MHVGYYPAISVHLNRAANIHGRPYQKVTFARLAIACGSRLPWSSRKECKKKRRRGSCRDEIIWNEMEFVLSISKSGVEFLIGFFFFNGRLTLKFIVELFIINLSIRARKWSFDFCELSVSTSFRSCWRQNCERIQNGEFNIQRLLLFARSLYKKTAELGRNGRAWRIANP